ncbi:MAG: hypothetical protein HY690_11290 [Chloroflexi bacterium]|nr:hypothetical protein [Chloroflexota bacterium]
MSFTPEDLEPLDERHLTLRSGEAGDAVADWAHYLCLRESPGRRAGMLATLGAHLSAPEREAIELAQKDAAALDQLAERYVPTVGVIRGMVQPALGPAPGTCLDDLGREITCQAVRDYRFYPGSDFVRLLSVRLVRGITDALLEPDTQFLEQARREGRALLALQSTASTTSQKLVGELPALSRLYQAFGPDIEELARGSAGLLAVAPKRLVYTRAHQALLQAVLTFEAAQQLPYSRARQPFVAYARARLREAITHAVLETEKEAWEALRRGLRRRVERKAMRAQEQLAPVLAPLYGGEEVPADLWEELADALEEGLRRAFFGYDPLWATSASHYRAGWLRYKLQACSESLVRRKQKEAERARQQASPPGAPHIPPQGGAVDAEMRELLLASYAEVQQLKGGKFAHRITLLLQFRPKIQRHREQSQPGTRASRTASMSYLDWKWFLNWFLHEGEDDDYLALAQKDLEREQQAARVAQRQRSPKPLDEKKKMALSNPPERLKQLQADWRQRYSRLRAEAIGHRRTHHLDPDEVEPVDPDCVFCQLEARMVQDDLEGE